MVVLYEDPKIAKFNSKLKKARIMRRLTQEELSALSGVNLKSLSSYEQNPDKLSNASANTVYKLANALGLEMMDILNMDTLEE